MNRPFAKALRDFKIRRPTRPQPADNTGVSQKDPPPHASPPTPPSPPSQQGGPEQTKPRVSTPPGRPAWDSYAYEDRAAYLQAYADVRPLTSREKAKPDVPPPSETPPDVADEDARARLAALLSRGLRFHVKVDEDGFVVGYREGADKGVRGALDRSGAVESTLDLHGFRRDEARQRLVEFIRSERRTGRRVVRVIHGKGRHSEGGTGVLADLVVETLTSEVIGFAILALRSEFSPDGRPASLTVLLSNPATGR